jgi:hypothetical protein
MVIHGCIYLCSNKHRKDDLIFNYKAGDILSITEESTCIVHLYRYIYVYYN